MDDSENFYAADRGCYEKAFTKGSFDSPELKAFRDGEAIDFMKGNIFSAGMVLIYAVNPASFDNYVSDYEKKEAKEIKLNSGLKSLENFLTPLLKKMTEGEPKNRMDFDGFSKAVQG